MIKNYSGDMLYYKTIVQGNIVCVNRAVKLLWSYVNLVNAITKRPTAGIALTILLILVSGCASSDVEIKFKQVIPISPYTFVEISKSINFNNVTPNLQSNYVLEKSQFYLPVDISNIKSNDYEKVLFGVTVDSGLIKKTHLYLPSGTPLRQPQQGFFEFDNKLLSGQTNEFRLVGEVVELGQNLSQGILNIKLVAYVQNGTNFIPIPNSHAQYELKICKNIKCG